MKKIFLLIIVILFGYIVFSHFTGPNIRAIPKHFSYLPYLHTEMASTIYPNIYLTNEEYTEYKSGSPSVATESVIIHESEHIKNWKKIGYLKFPFLYMTNKSFRLEEEKRAILVQMQFLKTHGEVYDIERKAKQFAGEEYGNVIEYKEAKELLEKMWLEL